jgi:hypothetical protein
MNWNNLLKWLLGAGIIFYILFIFHSALLVGIKEGDIASAIIGGALIPVLTLVVQFFFRKASDKEKV